MYEKCQFRNYCNRKATNIQNGIPVCRKHREQIRQKEYKGNY